MEKHRCKLCFRKFANGRALGGHMRSHMMNLPIPPKLDPPQPQLQPQQTLSFETESSTESPSFSSSSSSSSDSEQEDILMKDHTNDGVVKGVSVSIHGDHPTEPSGSSSLVTLQDRESETESFKKNPTRRRSKRMILKPSSTTSSSFHQHYNYNHNYPVIDLDHHHQQQQKEVSPVSSISEVTSDEDLAICLMMMSRDKWSRKKSSNFDSSSSRIKKKYKCETCNKVFRSYQALGGHRASHKKNRVSDNQNYDQEQAGNYSNNLNFEEIKDFEEIKEVGPTQNEEFQKKIHECPVCFRVFASGQALGGHKRSHVLVSGNNNNNNNNNNISVPSSDDHHGSDNPKKKMISGSNNTTNQSLIDLNLPAPVDYEDEEEEISQIDHVHL